MKIATNTSLSPIGGIARRAREMQRVVDSGEGDHRLAIIEIGPYRKTTCSLSRQGRTKRFRIPFPEPVKMASVYRGLRTLSELRERFAPVTDQIAGILTQEKVDVVLSEGTYYAPWCLQRAARLAGLPLVILYAGILKVETAHFPEPMRSLFIEMERDFINPANMYIFPSSLTRTVIEREYGPLPRGEIIPNGISWEFFRVVPADHSDGIAFVGRVSRVKNPEFLLRLKKELEGKGRNVRVTVVSDIPRKHPLRKQFSRAGIKIHPVMDTRRLAEFFRRSGLILSPSFFETYGNVPVEAVASGTPALISKNMGVKEVFIRHKLEHLVTDFSDLEEVLENISLFRRTKIDPETRESLKAYLWEAVIREYFRVCGWEIESSA